MDKASGKDKPPQFSIIPATPDDIPSFAELLADTLGRSSLMRSLVLDSDKRDFVVGLYKYRIETPLTKEEYKVFKAVSNQGQLMGSIAISHETGELCRDGKGTKRGEEIRNTPSFPGLRNELLRELLTGMGTLYDGLRGPHWYIQLLAVNPSFQRRGVGTALLEHVLRIAEGEKLPAYLVALPGTHDLYLREGFVDQAYDDLDLDAYVEDANPKLGIFRHQAMKREPVAMT